MYLTLAKTKKVAWTGTRVMGEFTTNHLPGLITEG